MATMPLPYDWPTIVRVAANGSYQAEAFTNVFHFAWLNVGDPTEGDLSDLVDVLGAATSEARALVNLYEPMDSGLLVTELVATNLDQTTPIQKSKVVSLAGTSGGTDAQALLAVVVQWRTAFASRRFRGRTFLCGVNTGMGASGNPDILDTSFSAVVAAAANGFENAWEADADWGFVVFSDKQARESEVPVSAMVTSGGVNPVFGVQRRRRPRM